MHLFGLSREPLPKFKVPQHADRAQGVMREHVSFLTQMDHPSHVRYFFRRGFWFPTCVAGSVAGAFESPTTASLSQAENRHGPREFFGMSGPGLAAAPQCGSRCSHSTLDLRAVDMYVSRGKSG